MGRLQDFPQVTPGASDNFLIVQSQGQGLAPQAIKMDSANPTGTGSLSINRKSGTTTGLQSIAIGYEVEASGAQSFATGLRAAATGNRSTASGIDTVASGTASFAEGYTTQATGQAAHSEGRDTQATANQTHAEGYGSIASGLYSHAQGNYTISNHRSQSVIGEYNIADASSAALSQRGNYAEIVGNGTNDANRSNARTLDWSGNETLAGGLKLHENQDAATLNLTGSIAASGGTLDCSSYSDGAIIFLYRPTANKVGIYVKTNTWTRVIPIVPISTVSVSGYVITNNDSEGLRGSVIST